MLDRYADAGGAYEEVVIADTGHSPHIEAPAEFASALHKGLSQVRALSHTQESGEADEPRPGT